MNSSRRDLKLRGVSGESLAVILLHLKVQRILDRRMRLPAVENRYRCALHSRYPLRGREILRDPLGSNGFDATGAEISDHPRR